tara:strand:+ start:348 stop:536 length:189 start_codon:yes stop_codon:yes gene_type:complete
MTIYYVTSNITYNRDYKVEADSKQEAIQQVKDGLVDHYDEDCIQTEIEEEWVKTEEEEGKLL